MIGSPLPSFKPLYIFASLFRFMESSNLAVENEPSCFEYISISISSDPTAFRLVTDKFPLSIYLPSSYFASKLIVSLKCINKYVPLGSLSVTASFFQCYSNGQPFHKYLTIF